MQEKSQKLKLALLLFIGASILFVTIYNLAGSKEPIEDDWSEYEVTTENQTEEPPTLQDNQSSHLEKKEEQEHDPVDEEDNFEKRYKDQFGAKSVKNGHAVAEKIVTMWLEEERDLTKWKELSTSFFLDAVHKNLLDFSDGASRKIKKIESYVIPLSSDELGDMKVEVNVQWTLNTSEHSGVFYVTLELAEDTNKWLVRELLQT